MIKILTTDRQFADRIETQTQEPVLKQFFWRVDVLGSSSLAEVIFPKVIYGLMLLSKMWMNVWLKLLSGSWQPFYVYQGKEILVEPRVSRIVVRASDLWGIFNNFCIIVVGTKNSLNWSQLNRANHKNAYSIQF